MPDIEWDKGSSGTRSGRQNPFSLSGEWTTNWLIEGTNLPGDSTPDNAIEVSRYVSPEAWALVSKDGKEPTNPLISFLTCFVGMVRRRIEGAAMDTYLSTDPDTEDTALVLRVDTGIEDMDTRLQIWEELSRDANDLWFMTLRNRDLPDEPCPFSVVIW